MRNDILTVTLNPALDLSAHLPCMTAGPKLRLHDPVIEPGGGGVNVARVIHELGGNVSAWVALGGTSGAQHLDLLRAKEVVVHVFEAPGETRQNWAITDAMGQQYRLQLPGPDWTPDSFRNRANDALDSITALANGPVVLSGSQPPGLDPAFPQTLAARLGPGRLVVDTSGDAMTLLITRPEILLCLLRLDQAEAEAQAGHPLADPKDAADFAKALRSKGVAELIAIARGADGNILAAPQGVFHARPPQVPVLSKIGAGDSFTGAFTLALAQGQSPSEALRLGTAAAAATVMSAGTGLCRAADVTRLLRDCSLAQLDA
ncbi:MAG: hexose kinase [Natronohydrobacter sp.]|nr:hexose kinase [Natronohydrobacter sp.]